MMATQSGDGSDRKVKSSACSMDVADDAYMGFAGRDELVGCLNELLEAERAGAQVTGDTARASDSGRAMALMRAIQQDEAHWCAMLTRQINARGGAPSRKVGAFYGKAMAITDIGARIAFLNRGQGWVVRKLRDMLPRVRDDRLHADLSAMLKSHEANIMRADDLMTNGPKL